MSTDSSFLLLCVSTEKTGVCRVNWTKMVDSQVDAARQLSLSAMKNLKRFINIEIAGPHGPSSDFAGPLRCVLGT